MKNRTFGYASLLAVIGVSIVFGMLLGGWLNAPEVTFAAPVTGPPVRLTPAVTGSIGSINFADVVEGAMPAVVSVRSTSIPGEGEEEGDEQGEGDMQSPEEFFRRFFGSPDPSPQPPPGHPRIGEGSGFIISEDGYLLTNNHVVEGATRVSVGTNDGREFEATVVGTDPSIDLALLKIKDPNGGTLPTLPLGDSEQLRVGEWVIAIGNPLEFEQTVTVGVVSAKQRRVQIGQTDAGVVSFLQTDAAINFGNSGGPLLDAHGNVVGINTAIRRANYAEGIGFALPINHARMVIDQLRERGYVKRGFIGITMNQGGIDEEAREYLAVAPNGPAEEAGVQKYDVIRKVDGGVVKDNLDLISKIASKQPGDEVMLEIYRKNGDRSQTLTVTAELKDRDEGLAATNRPQRRTPGRSSDPEPETASGLGMTVTGLTGASRERVGLDDGVEGVIVSDVEFESQATEKGIGRDMVISTMNNRPVRSVSEFAETMDGLEPGEVIKLDVIAGRREFTVFLRMPE
jgi:serine protease Do